MQGTIFCSPDAAKNYFKTILIAFQCRLKGGAAVYRARSILALVIDTIYFDKQICNPTGGDSDRMMLIAPPPVTATDSTPPKQALSAAMFPNPATDYTILQLNQPVQAPMQLKITDDIGQTVVDVKVSFTTGSYNINTVTFGSGIYYVNLYNYSDKVFGGKLCIFHK